MRPLLLALSFLLISSARAEDGPAAAAAAAATDQATILATTPPTDLAAALGLVPSLPVFSKSLISLEVVNAATGAKLFTYGDDRLLMPASTMKLITSAVALRELGPAYRFPTWIKYDGELGADGVLEGNLYVVGQGDPTMVVERMWRMVADIKAKGVSEVKGDIVFDDSYMAGPGVWIPGWDKPEDLEDGNTYYSALGALSLNYNIATIVVRPGAAVGSAAQAGFDTPSDVLVLDNQLTTGRANSKYWVKVERTLDEKNSKIATYKLTGNVPVDQAPDNVYRTLADPTGNYVSVFRELAKSVGIKVKGRHKVGVAPVESKLLFKAESERLAEILTDMNKQSNNFIAEQVLRTVAAERGGLPGTTAGGVKILGDYMASLGVPADRYKFVNGSGLSREMMIAPSAMDAVLVDMHANVDVGPEYLTTLAVGGRDGTLWHRFREDGMEGRVRAKTGSLAGVFCLAGYVTAADGTDYAFSFFVNDLEGSTARARAAHDQLVRSLAGVTGNLAEAGDGGGD
ncbi:peptidase M15 [Deltaproteobacteria bacterium]|nr:peptidase M15 [Deltaproteobacteria bacterium]